MSDNSEGGPSGQARVSPTSRVVLVLVVGGVFLMWTFLPAWDLLVRPVAPAVRSEVTEAMEAATDPAERADLRLRLADVEQEDAARETGLRTGIATLLAGSVAVWGAVAAWRQLQDNRRQAEAAREETAEQLRLSREELRLSQDRTTEELRLSREEVVLSRDSQLVDRFTRAVDQLGNDNLDVRLGGIYALERTASDSERDLPTVVEVLAAFVRGHCPRPLERSDVSASEVLALEFMRLSGHDDRRGGPDKLSRRAPDVQAALTVLGRMERERGSIIVDLATTNLEGAELVDANLWGAHLGIANLSRANLRDAELGFAYLGYADLMGADLTRANLRGANLRGANLRGAELWGADLRNAQLVAADLRGAHLRTSDLRAADFRDAQLEEGEDDFMDAKADAETTWPDSFGPEAAGVTFVDHEEPT